MSGSRLNREHKAFLQCYKVYKNLSSLNSEYIKLIKTHDLNKFTLALIRFTRKLIRVKRLLGGLLIAYRDIVDLKFNLEKGEINLGLKGVSRSLEFYKPIKMHPLLLEDILKDIPKYTSEIELQFAKTKLDIYTSDVLLNKIMNEIERLIDERIKFLEENEAWKKLYKSKIQEAELIPPRKASAMLGVSYKTLWRWWKEGKIRAIQTPSGRLRYYKTDIEKLLGK